MSDLALALAFNLARVLLVWCAAGLALHAWRLPVMRIAR